jgi:hypothetical protein
MAQQKIKMFGESELMMNYKLRRKPNIVTTIKVKRLQWAGHVVRTSDGRTVKKAFLGNQMEVEKQEDQN